MSQHEKWVKFLREQYPAGTRLRLSEMKDPYSPVPPGTEGTVELVDDGCNIHMKGDGLFAPMDNITRAEFAAIAARFDSDSYTGPDKFSDIATSWAREEINRAAHKGWVTGDGTGAFRPNDLMTRAEAVVLINNLLERHVNADGLLPGMLTFSDNKDEAAWYYYPIQEAANAHTYTKSNGMERCIKNLP